MVSNTKFVNAMIKEIKRCYQICKYVSLCWRDQIDSTFYSTRYDIQRIKFE